MNKDALVPVSFWAVGRVAETAQVAIKFNDLPPILMSVENAREIAAALKSEAHASAVARLMSPKQSARSLKK